ncbi:MAG: hypothetical protein KAR39_07055 [Thermoplasmata archaeon]|nr:hypothetical protein [Thermoplasmata archaeon]
MPSVDVDSNGKIFVAFTRFNTSNQSKGIYIAISDNGGISFDRIRKVNDNISWGEQPSVAIGDDDKIHVVWKDWRNDADLKWVSGGGIDGINNADIYYANSTDGGKSFNPSVRVDDDGGTSSVATSISRRILALDSLRGVHVVWMDAREGFPTIYYANSTDGGISFSENIKVPHVDANAMNPSLAISPNDEVFVAWYDYRNASTNADIYLAFSTNGGLSFGGDTRVNDDFTNWDQIHPVVAAHQNFVSVVWQDMRSGGSSVYFSKSIDKGSTFSPNRRVDDGSAGAMNPTIAIDETGYIVVAWEDTRGANRSIYFSNSTSQGLSFSPNQEVRDDEAGNVGSPSMTMDRNGYVYLAWSDTRNIGDQDIFFARAPAEIADLLPISIAFNPSSPVDEFTVTDLNATIVNIGNRDAAPVNVQFFDGDPSLGQQIGVNITIPSIQSGGIGYAEASWVATPIGLHDIFVVVDPENSVTESNETNNVAFATIEVMPPPEDILPPEDLRTRVVDNDIRLDWNPPSGFSNMSHYLIYRDEDQREFDFSVPLYNTSTDLSPLRTNWTDLLAASSGSPGEYYYVVRTVSLDSRLSTTSNTAGKWTRSFNSGVNAFSLPLEPFEDQNISDYAVGIPNVNLIRWMDSNGHWVTHYLAMGPGINDAPARMGEGYEISLSSLATYTFVGSPASMIRFQEGLGDPVVFRKSLAARIEGNDVNLSWNAPVGADRYLVFRSDERDGLHDLSLSPIANTTETYWRDTGIIGNQKSEQYYMIIPLDSTSGTGSSTYSVGVTTVVYEGGSDTFALPLRPMEDHTLDWYCDAIPDVAGMAHMIFELWKYHAKEMPQGVYDMDVLQGEGYQISINGPSSKFTFVGY